MIHLRRRADLRDAPLLHDGDAVGQSHRLGLVVRDIERRRAGVREHGFELRPHLEPQQRIEIGQRLVHQQHGRLDGERARHRDALALPARELRGIAREQRLDMQQRGRALDLALHARLRRARHAQPEGDILEHGQMREYRIVLEHHREPALPRRQVRHVAPADQHAPAALPLEPRDDAQQRRLAAARRPEQREELAVAHAQRHIAERGDGAEGFLDVIDLDDRHQRELTPHMENSRRRTRKMKRMEGRIRNSPPANCTASGNSGSTESR